MPSPILVSANASRFLAAASSNNRKDIIRVDVYNSSGELVYQDLPYITGGSVTVDETQQVRRQLSLTLSSQGLTPNSEGLNFDDIVPVKAGDLLHPATQNELYVYRGFQYEDGTQDLIQLGVFRISKPVVTDDSQSITITISGNDRSTVISRNQWINPYSISSGTDLAAAIKAAITNRWFVNGITLDYSGIMQTNPVPLDSNNWPNAGLNLTLNPTIWGNNPTSSNDPWADMVTLAGSGGMALYWSPLGQPNMRPVAAPSGVAPTYSSDVFGTLVFPLLYQEGVNCTITKMGRTLDETHTKNGVIAYGTGAPPTTFGQVPLLPVVGVAWNTDPTSPTYYDPANPGASPWGPAPISVETQSIPAPGDTQASAQQKINAYAWQQLQLILTTLDTPTFSCVPNPALWEGDVIALLRKRIGVNSTDTFGNVLPVNYVVSKMTIPLDYTSEMTVTCRPVRQP